MMWLSSTTKENKHERKMFVKLRMVLKMNNGEKKPIQGIAFMCANGIMDNCQVS